MALDDCKNYLQVRKKPLNWLRAILRAKNGTHVNSTSTHQYDFTHTHPHPPTPTHTHTHTHAHAHAHALTPLHSVLHTTSNQVLELITRF